MVLGCLFANKKGRQAEYDQPPFLGDVLFFCAFYCVLISIFCRYIQGPPGRPRVIQRCCIDVPRPDGLVDILLKSICFS